MNEVCGSTFSRKNFKDTGIKNNYFASKYKKQSQLRKIVKNNLMLFLLFILILNVGNVFCSINFKENLEKKYGKSSNYFSVNKSNSLKKKLYIHNFEKAAKSNDSKLLINTNTKDNISSILNKNENAKIVNDNHNKIHENLKQNIIINKEVSKLNTIDKKEEATKIILKEFQKNELKEKRFLKSFTEGFYTSLSLNYFAELGDKSFILIITLYNNFDNTFLLLFVCLLGQLSMTFLSVLLGSSFQGGMTSGIAKIFYIIGFIMFTVYAISFLYDYLSVLYEQEDNLKMIEEDEEAKLLKQTENKDKDKDVNLIKERHPQNKLYVIKQNKEVIDNENPDYDKITTTIIVQEKDDMLNDSIDSIIDKSISFDNKKNSRLSTNKKIIKKKFNNYYQYKDIKEDDKEDIDCNSYDDIYYKNTNDSSSNEKEENKIENVDKCEQSNLHCKSVCLPSNNYNNTKKKENSKNLYEYEALSLKILKSLSNGEIKGHTKINTTMYEYLKIYGMVFLAELGDRSSITTIILTTKYPASSIFFGNIFAHTGGIISALFIGFLIKKNVNLNLLKLLSAIVFFAFAIQMAYNYFTYDNSLNNEVVK